MPTTIIIFTIILAIILVFLLIIILGMIVLFLTKVPYAPTPKGMIKKIIDEFPESKFKSKSMFALVFVYEALDDSISSEQIKLNLLKNFPDSEYTSYLTGGGEITDSNGQKMIFKQAKSEMLHDKKKGIDILKSVIQINSEDEYEPTITSCLYHQTKDLLCVSPRNICRV